MARQSKGNSITLSKQHGLNPSLQICFFCGKEKGIVMLGKLKGDAKAPDKMITDYEPCTECAEKFKQGILWIEVVDKPLHPGMFEIAYNSWPTGRYAVTTEAMLDHLETLNPNAKTLMATVREKRKALIDKQTFEALGFDKGGNNNG